VCCVHDTQKCDFYILYLLKEGDILSQNKPILAAGRRKSSVAQVKLVPGVGNVTINGKTANDYLQKDALSLHVIEEPLKTVSFEDKYDLVIKVQGGGLKGQAKAIQLGIARLLSTYQTSYRSSLKQKGFLTRDARVKERRKYGLKKARKASQFSKR
jgi:small subunit ribosomal protein S9